MHLSAAKAGFGAKKADDGINAAVATADRMSLLCQILCSSSSVGATLILLELDGLVSHSLLLLGWKI